LFCDFFVVDIFGQVFLFFTQVHLSIRGSAGWFFPLGYHIELWWWGICSGPHPEEGHFESYNPETIWRGMDWSWN